MDTLRVWVNDKPVGRLSRHGKGVTFAYDEGVDAGDAVSLLMPVRVKSYDVDYGMLPIFDVSMPEGALLARIERVLAKDDRGRTDQLDVLSVTGGNQIGRIRILPVDTGPERRDKITSIDDLLATKSNPAMIEELFNMLSLRSGVSGAMPKVLVETDTVDGQLTTLQTRDWILKFDDIDFPGLSLNEYHCMIASGLCGNETSSVRLADDGRMLAVKRFDEFDSKRLGFEDFAALNAKVSKEKYKGSLETALLKTVAAVSRENARDNLKNMYRQIVTSIALRNGDAHLKNYGILYTDAILGPVMLAPVYDIVTTRAFEQYKNDTMSLTLEGSKEWPDVKKLKKLSLRAKLPPKETQAIFDQVAVGIREQLPVMHADLTERGFGNLADRIALEWNNGLEFSLGAERVNLEPALDLTTTKEENSSPSL